MKKIISLLSAFVFVFCMLQVTAYADETVYRQINLSAEQFSYDSASSVIQKALNEARDNATDYLPYQINIPAGAYYLDTTLFVYSNTKLHLDDGATLLQTAPKGQNIIKAGFKEVNSGYGGYRNITVDGGTFNMNFNGSCAMRFGHCTNVNITNVNVCNVKNAHHIEAAGVDSMNVTNCMFTSTVRSEGTTNSCEAIQLDILHDSTHFPGYENFDDTPNKNITISGCTFTDLYSGIGTRSGVSGSYFDNINIVNNKFNNIKEKAISCFNYKNSNISSNTFIDVNYGISFEYLPNNISSGNKRMYKPNSGISNALDPNCSTTISNNTLNITEKNGSSSCAIYVYGAILDSATAKKRGVTGGDYRIQNITISNNEINCLSSESRGIFVTGVNKSNITGNYLYDSAFASNGINAVNVCSSEKNNISANVIDGTFNNGISLYDNGFAYSKNTDISSNVIKSVLSYGIRIATNSFATIRNDNNIQKSGKSPICINSKNYNQNIGTVTVRSTEFSQKGKPVVRLLSVNGNSGYKVYRSTNNGSLAQIATVPASSLNFEDKSARVNAKNYYRIFAYKTVEQSVIVGNDYVDASF